MINDGLSLRQMAKELNQSFTTTKYWVNKFKLKTNPYNRVQHDGHNFKYCPRCKVLKETNSKNFYAKGNTFQSLCKECFGSYCMERWINRKKKAIEYKGGKCIDCNGVFDYYLYDFHHLDRSTKEYDWAKLRLFGWKRIQSELDKCVLLCCMCHRKREYGAEAGT